MKINEINVLELKKKIDSNENLTIIDIRESSELDICKIEKTVHIPMMEIPNQINKFMKTQELIILCKKSDLKLCS